MLVRPPSPWAVPHESSAAIVVGEDRVRAVFEKDELAARPQDPSHTLQALHHARNPAQRKGANNGIDSAVPKGMRPPGRSTNSMSRFVR